MIGPDSVIYSIEKVKLIRDWLKSTQSRQKSYADVGRRELEFKVNHRVFLESVTYEAGDEVGKKGKLVIYMYALTRS